MEKAKERKKERKRSAAFGSIMTCEMEKTEETDMFILQYATYDRKRIRNCFIIWPLLLRLMFPRDLLYMYRAACPSKRGRRRRKRLENLTLQNVCGCQSELGFISICEAVIVSRHCNWEAVQILWSWWEYLCIQQLWPRYFGLIKYPSAGLHKPFRLTA